MDESLKNQERCIVPKTGRNVKGGRGGTKPNKPVWIPQVSSQVSEFY